MVNPSICAPCRMRKVRCDSKQPECGQCLQARRMFKCTYDTPTSKPTRDNLRKGEACTPCRRKKKKCDAAQPICDRCSTAGIGHECFYKERPPHKSPTLKDTATVFLDTPQIPSPTLSATSVVCPPSPPTSSRQSTLPVATMELPFSTDAGGPSSAVSASPLDIDQANARLPDASLDDLNTSFRLMFLVHREQFGFYLPFGKHQAVILGDMSNACVHPFFVHFAHTIGCHLYQARRADSSMQEMQNAHLALAYQTLQRMKEKDDPFIYGQAHHYLALSAFYSRVTQTAIAYHEEAVRIVERNALHILKDPSYTISDLTHLEASEVLERAVFLGNLLRIEILLDMFGAKKRTLCYAIEEEFRYRFPKAFPFLFQVSPSILGVRSMLLFKEASDIINSAAKSGVGMEGPANSCLELISTLNSHIDALTKLLTELSNKDHASAVSSRSSLVESLTALAEIHEFMSRISLEPLATEYRRQCVMTLMRAVEVTHGLGPEDFMIIGAFLGISLKRLSTLLNSTINQLYRTPIEGIDIKSLDSGVAVLADAKEWLRTAFHLVLSTPDSLPSQLSELLI
ncbi:hypothetical protein BDM02DRAFT_1892850 [Thelephora ganbajun]|uniref:Uncharacterized protein n=1 Tax=Thelephora ganbajun TaxID=370292 RepID=A0ACB6ZUQ9_THEGA|nr:hypothetical protein BDM02DRAFT_1892850 [Thelephora ganbajun]